MATARGGKGKGTRVGGKRAAKARGPVTKRGADKARGPVTKQGAAKARAPVGKRGDPGARAPAKKKKAAPRKKAAGGGRRSAAGRGATGGGKTTSRRGAAWAAPPSDGPGAGTGAPAAGVQAPTGRAEGAEPYLWYTCGLGSGLLAYNALLFAILVALTYAAGIFVLYLMMLFLMALFAPRPQPGGGGCDLDCGGGGCCDGCCNDCDCGCDDCGGCDCGCATDVGGPEAPALSLAVLAVPHARRAALQDAFAHHPRSPAYDQDVFHVAGARLCVGCFTTYPVFLAAIAALSLLMPPWSWWAFLAVGAPLAGVQAISSAGWARRRSVKFAVKAALGSGLALLVHGILQTPWPNMVQAVLMGFLLLVAMASALPRRRRLRRQHAGAP